MKRVTKWLNDGHAILNMDAPNVRNATEILADFEDLEEFIGIPLKELAEIFKQHIPDGCQHPKKAIVLTDGDVDKWREYRQSEEPRSPLDDGAFGICPRCHTEFNSELVNEYDIKYCPYCGQKLY